MSYPKYPSIYDFLFFPGFVLVIQEKDHVILKVVKQRLRLALRRDRESQAKLDKYRVSEQSQI